MIKHRFFQSICEMAAANQIITPMHMGLITALLYFADGKQPLSYFHSSRKKLMRLSRIKSFATYHRCMADLTQHGFIEYIPSWHPKQASRFRFTMINKEDSHG